jgi:hypothetical protein
MGWSCAAKAAHVRDAVEAILKAEYGIETSNGMPGGGFWENSRREHADGAITGTVWRPLTAAEIEKSKITWPHIKDWDGRVQKAGSFKVTGDGKIARWAGLPKGVAAKAEEVGARRYTEIHEHVAAMGGNV